MKDLQINLSTFRVYRISDFLPAFNLRLGIDTGLAPEGRIAFDGHGRFSDDQAGRGTLGVILNHHIRGNVISVGTDAGEGGHEDPIGQFTGAHFQGSKKCVHSILGKFCVQELVAYPPVGRAD